jgi:hypothetical protein
MERQQGFTRVTKHTISWWTSSVKILAPASLPMCVIPCWFGFSPPFCRSYDRRSVQFGSCGGTVSSVLLMGLWSAARTCMAAPLDIQSMCSMTPADACSVPLRASCGLTDGIGLGAVGCTGTCSDIVVVSRVVGFMADSHWSGSY